MTHWVTRLHELLGLDKELRSIRGLLKVKTRKKVQLQQRIEKEKHKLSEIESNPEYIQEDIKNRIERLNNTLKVRQESINHLKGRLTNQITGIKEMITKVLDRDTSLAEKIWMLYREQGIKIASVLTAIGTAIGVLVEALLPSREGAAAQGSGDKLGNAKEWIRNKLKALASLLGRISVKVAKALPGIIGAIISWILNGAK